MTPVVTAADVVRRVLGGPATLGDGRLLCVDGPAGSGKTTFAAAVRESVPQGLSCRVLHMDDVYPGWSGLADGAAAVTDHVVVPLARGLPGRYRRYDWFEGRLAEDVDVAPVDLLVVEGVGSGAHRHARWITLLVWLEAAEPTRLVRASARDGDPLRDHWADWVRQEREWFAHDRTRDRADLVIGTDEPSA